jgi:peptidoglycan/xylan/chitin deacetylase (PgdA/CDA1 family)
MLKGSKFACLTYHAIGDSDGQYTLSAKQLEYQLAFLQREAYVIDDFEGLELKLRSRQGLPSCYVVLTVDDGLESALWAADLLGECGCHASFFLTRDRSMSKPGYIREKDIRELRKRGFSVGTHGATHRKLTFLPKEQCLAELAESKRWLEDVIGEEVRYMAAPGGFINSRVMKSAYECGYALIGTCNEWINSPDSITLPGGVNRVNVRGHFSIQTFRHIVEGHLGFYLRRQIRATALTVPKRLICRLRKVLDVRHSE